MTTFVLDNSVTMRWCFEDSTHLYAEGVLRQLTTGLAVVPILWRYEVSAVLAKSQKDGTLTAAKVDDFLLRLGRLNIKVDPESADHILTDVYRLAVTYKLTSYDASYLELAFRMGLPLATLDDELVKACKASGVVLL